MAILCQMLNNSVCSNFKLLVHCLNGALAAVVVVTGPGCFLPIAFFTMPCTTTDISSGISIAI